MAAAKKLTDQEFRALVQEGRDGAKGAKTLRTKLLKHRASGGALNPNDYDILLSTYLKLNKKNWPVGLADAKSKKDPELAAIVDELLASIRAPNGKKFLTGSRKTGWSFTGVLTNLAPVLVGLGRVRDAVEMYGLYFTIRRDMTSGDAVLFMRAAVRLKEREPLETAIKAFGKVKNEGYEFVKEWEKNKKLVKTFAATPKGTKGGATVSAADKKKASTPEGKVSLVIDVIKKAGGKATAYDGEKYSKPKPLPPAKVSKLALPNGKPLPPSLKAWLGFDSSWLPLFKKKGGGWDVMTVAEFFRKEAEELEIDEDLQDVIPNALPAGVKKDTTVVELPGSASQRHLLAFGKDKGGEHPVLGYEKEELWVKYPSFADFVIDYFNIDS